LSTTARKLTGVESPFRPQHFPDADSDRPRSYLLAQRAL
jgi:hypothetical protein